MMHVKMLHWPSQERQRERYKELGVPRILVLEGDTRPPSPLDALEDWVRSPIQREDMQARLVALQTRAFASLPVVDSNEILRFGGQCIPLSPGDAQLMRLMIEYLQCVIPREALTALIGTTTPPRRNALDLRMLRLRRKIAPLHLTIRTVRLQGYLLDVAVNHVIDEL
jgi:DNA-binding response OmpR family regulator